jgi:Hypothetical protein (DUF2513)
MKRDMDLIREILLAIEQDEKMDGLHWFIFDGPDDLNIKNCSLEEFSYTIGLMQEAGLFQAEEGSVLFPAIGGLSWQGHDFLNDIRDPDVWRKTKERAKGVASVGVGFLWEIAKAEVRAKLGLP